MNVYFVGVHIYDKCNELSKQSTRVEVDTMTKQIDLNY